MPRNPLFGTMGIRPRTQNSFVWHSLISVLCSFPLFCHGTNSIAQGQIIRDGETITSPSQKFVLGFFSPGNSLSRYVGIWYNVTATQSVVWVANRESPISSEFGILTVGNAGNLMVLDGHGNPLWSTNSPAVPGNSNSTAILMDTGNLILSSSESVGDQGKAIWQSFDDPTDTFLPDMKVYIDVESDNNRVFNSWKNENDPSIGKYSIGIDPHGSPQIVIWDGLNRHWRSGHWNGIIFIGVPTMRTLYSSGFKLIRENGMFYFTYTLRNASDLMRFRIGSDGYEEQFRWDKGTSKWSIVQFQPSNDCEAYNRCGNYGICNVMEIPICSCLRGFVPKFVSEWEGENWSGGCVRRTNLGCGNISTRNASSDIGVAEGESVDGFLKIEGVKLPDFASLVMVDRIDECRQSCLQNFSCHAYAFVTGINCMVWSGDLIDMQRFVDGANDLYIRVAHSELGNKKKISKLLIILLAVIGVLFISVSIWLLWRVEINSRCRISSSRIPMIGSRSSEYSTDISGSNELGIEGQQRNGQELSLYSLSYIAAATNNFSDENKLGEGGFGPVYKAKLPGREEIAVKRLSRKSGQGLEEFKNEIILIKKLQHRNLVRIVGCCIQGEEKMLLYEYMPNRSLDKFLFDQTKQAELDWKTRYTITEGIARGLLYLHRDSRLRIIHRDLKASNILLDEEMNPKISDFGMAKMFGRNENEASTSRVVGTYGYMAPEYATEGLFSVKSDVYSFGILLLEIVCGRRNSSFHCPEYSNIIEFAWDLWDGGRPMELIDPAIKSSCSQDEVMRCIHVAMLCVQDSAAYRPNMSSVVLMLECENATILPMPRQPTFTSMRRSGDLQFLKTGNDIPSSNDLTISSIIGR